MLTLLLWFIAVVSCAKISDEGYTDATSVEALVAELRAELVPLPMPSPMKFTHQPLRSRKDFSPRPEAALISRQTCTNNADRVCFEGSDGDHTCTNCGICCVFGTANQLCCLSSGEICCETSSSGCCGDYQTCSSSGCVDPS